MEVEYIQPRTKKDAPKEGYKLIPIPFVGIYNSILDAYIDIAIEQISDMEEPPKKVTVNLDPIYESIIRYTSWFLLDNDLDAKYAGTSQPKFYNYRDDQPYLEISDRDYKRIFGDKEFPEYSWENERFPIMEKLIIERLWKLENKEVHPEDHLGTVICEMWYDSTRSWGYEVIDNAIDWEF